MFYHGVKNTLGARKKIIIRVTQKYEHIHFG